MIFAVFDVLLAVNMCINYSFFTIIMEEQHYYMDWANDKCYIEK